MNVSHKQLGDVNVSHHIEQALCEEKTLQWRFELGALKSRAQSRLFCVKGTQVFHPPGDHSYSPVHNTNNNHLVCRLGSTGELTLELHSLSGLQEAGQEVTNSKYFSQERQGCDFEIGTGDSVSLTL